ncbi:unnamed protein product [Polarella glacialis]|uniref:Uncharacterized protein n=1 Tax=Polarella glacialis TaxID=89957 RepID=A0A813JU81_POLGL|nr:unnamed protein product [Polarella glacialis]
MLASSYAKFSLPSLAEGFDEVRYEWLGEGEAGDHLRKWILQQKERLVVEGLTPGPWFASKIKAWKEARTSFRHAEFSARAKSDPTLLDLASSSDLSAVKDVHDADGSGMPVYAGFKYEVMVVLPARSLVLRGLLAVLLAATVSTARSADEQKTEDWKLCSSICRAANGKRMVVSSAYSIECWAGGNDGVLRILDRLVHSFASDVADPDRPGIPEDHVAHYFSVYFETKLEPRARLGVDGLDAVVKLLREPVVLSEVRADYRILKSELDKDTPIEAFVLGVEAFRRDRNRRIEAGDESAQLSFPKPQAKQAPHRRAPPAQPALHPVKAKPPAKAPGDFNSTGALGPAATRSPPWKRPEVPETTTTC